MVSWNLGNIKLTKVYPRTGARGLIVLYAKYPSSRPQREGSSEACLFGANFSSMVPALWSSQRSRTHASAEMARRPWDRLACTFLASWQVRGSCSLEQGWNQASQRKTGPACASLKTLRSLRGLSKPLGTAYGGNMSLHLLCQRRWLLKALLMNPPAWRMSGSGRQLESRLVALDLELGLRRPSRPERV